MPQKIFRAKDLISGVELYYTSITALLEDGENMINITNRRWSQIVKEKRYPFEVAGWRVDLIYALTTKDVRENNPATVDE